MPTNKAVVDVIEQWSGKRPNSTVQNLKDWWNQTAPGSTHSALKFEPDGIEDLLKRVQNAFPSSPIVVSGDFGDSGNIKTVQDLVDALQPVVADVVADTSSGGGELPAPRPRRARQKAAPKRTARRRKPRKTTKGLQRKKSPSPEKASRKTSKSIVKSRSNRARKKIARKRARKK